MITDRHSLGVAGKLRQIVHVSYQDPWHLAGGQGVAVETLTQAQATLGYEVHWLSPCVRDEVPGHYAVARSRLAVVKLRVQQEQIARAAELGLGASSPADIEVVSVNGTSDGYRNRIVEILEQG